MIDAKLEGADQLSATLHRAGDEIAKLDESADAVGKLILEASRTRAPVRTGNLVASGGYKGSQVTYEAPYSGPIHWGWAARGIQAQPFLWGAANATQAAWLDVYANLVQEELNKVRGI